MEHLRTLKSTQPEEWTNTKISKFFGISISAVVRILRSKFEPPQEVKDRQDQKAKEKAQERHAMFKKKLFQPSIENKTEESKVAKGSKGGKLKSNKTMLMDCTSVSTNDKSTKAEVKTPSTSKRSRTRTESVGNWESKPNREV